MRWRCSFFLWAASFLALLTVTGCDNGHVVGNGRIPTTDDVPPAYERGREHAIRVVERLTEDRLRSTQGDLNADAQALLLSRTEILTDLRTVPLLWKSTDRFDCSHHRVRDCACTGSDQGNEVYFSPASCDANATEFEVGERLLHEVLHHFFGSDEATVFRLAALAYGTSWRQVRPDSPERVDMPQREGVPQPIRSRGLSIAVGNSVVVWDPYRERALSIFSGNSWRKTQLSPSVRIPIDLGPAFRRGGSHDGCVNTHSANGNKFYVLFYGFPCPETPFQIAGMTTEIEIDSKTGEWRRLRAGLSPPPDTFATHRTPQLQLARHNSTPRRAELVRKEDPVGRNARVWVFDPAKENWKGIPVPLDVRPWPFRQVRSRKAVYVVSEAIPWMHAQRIWRLDTATRGWTELPDAPVERNRRSALAATEDGLLLFGGHRPDPITDDSVDRGGLWWDEAQSEWRMLPPRRGPHRVNSETGAVADGHRIHVFGTEWMTYTPATNTWELLHPSFDTWLRRATHVFPTGVGTLFWDADHRDGYLWRL